MSNLLICPACDEITTADQWQEFASTDCETCGEHELLICPACEHVVDTALDVTVRNGRLVPLPEWF